MKYKIIRIKSNSDNGTPYGSEEYSSEDYINLLRYASCLIGNSSSFLKESSIFGTPVVNIGKRQQNRLTSENVVSVPFDKNKIRTAIRMQLDSERKPSKIYYKPATSYNIVQEISKFLKV